jgi:hypothetical protein
MGEFAASMKAPWSSDRMAEAWEAMGLPSRTRSSLVHISTDACPQCGGDHLLWPMAPHCELQLLPGDRQ